MDRAFTVQLHIPFLKQELRSSNQKINPLAANGYLEHKRSHVGPLLVKIKYVMPYCSCIYSNFYKKCAL